MASQGCEIHLFLGFEKLRSKDLLSASDPFAVIELQDSRTKKWNKLGQTTYLKNLATGRWAESFSMTFYFEISQNVRCLVYDYDSLSNHDFIGEAMFTLGNVMGSSGQQLKVSLGKPGRPVKDRGAIMAYAEQKGDGSLLRLKLAATKLDKKDFMGFGRSDPYYVIHRLVNTDWIPMHKSEYINSNSHPQWKEALLSLDKVCRGNIDEQLKISVIDFDEGSKHDLIGDAYVSIRQLLEAAGSSSIRFDLKHPPTKKKYQSSKYVNSGLLICASAQVEKSPQELFVEYLRGGLEINLVTAIDFTASNGDVRNPNSLHFMSDRPNQYQTAIQAVGDILAPYDHDGQIGLFGFGGVVNNAVSHCFSLGQTPQVYGIPGVLEAYRNVLYSVPLSGPTFFAPLIRTVAQTAFNPELSQNSQSYTVLLILTDGEVMDMQATVDEIVAGSQLGLSVVIVGVGSADFSKMEYLDGDNIVLKSSRGISALRDIVQFVPFSKCQGSGEILAKETLAEIPGQVVSFFQKRNIKPNPPSVIPVAAPASPPPSAPQSYTF